METTKKDKSVADAAFAAGAIAGVLCLPAAVPVDGASMFSPEIAEAIGWIPGDVLYGIAEPYETPLSSNSRDFAELAQVAAGVAFSSGGAGPALVAGIETSVVAGMAVGCAMGRRRCDERDEDGDIIEP